MRWQIVRYLFYLVGEQGKVRIQVQVLPHSHKLDSLRRSWLARREKVLLRSSRRLPCLRARIRNGSQTASSTAIMIPRTRERNANRTTCSFHFPPILLPSYFASHPGACSPLRSLLACKSTWNQFDQSCSSLVYCATAGLGISTLERRNKKSNKHTHSPSLTTYCSRIPPRNKRPNGGVLVSIVNAFQSQYSSVHCQTHDDDDDALLWPCCQRRAQSPGIAHTPVVHRLAIPEPIILVLKSVSSARPAPGAEAEMTRANVM